MTVISRVVAPVDQRYDTAVSPYVLLLSVASRRAERSEQKGIESGEVMNAASTE